MAPNVHSISETFKKYRSYKKRNKVRNSGAQRAFSLDKLLILKCLFVKSKIFEFFLLMAPNERLKPMDYTKTKINPIKWRPTWGLTTVTLYSKISFPTNKIKMLMIYL